MTFLQARTANEVLKAQERRLRLQQLKGELVDRARASAWCSAWPATSATPGRLAGPHRGVIAAELGFDTHHLQTVLDRHVREHLDQLAERPAR